MTEISTILTDDEHTILARMITGAIFDFAGMLTTLEIPITVSAKHNAAPMVELVKDFLNKRGVPNCDDPFVKEWDVLLAKVKG